MRSVRVRLGVGLLVLALSGCSEEDTNLPFTFTTTPGPGVVAGPVPVFFRLVNQVDKPALASYQYVVSQERSTLSHSVPPQPES